MGFDWPALELTLAEEFARDDSPGRGRGRRSFAVRGELLRSLRLARGWSQSEAARRADLSDRLIRKAEKGERLEVKSISQLAGLYGSAERPLSPESLLVDREETVAGPAPTAALRATLQRWFDGLWNQLDLSVVDELIVPEFAFHTETGVIRNREELKSRVLKFRESFSDFEFVLEHVSDLGDAVVCRWRATMTHSGTWIDLPPTGRRVTVHGSSWAQLAGTKFGDAWDYWDPAALYLQLKGED